MTARFPDWKNTYGLAICINLAIPLASASILQQEGLSPTTHTTRDPYYAAVWILLYVVHAVMYQWDSVSRFCEKCMIGCLLISMIDFLCYGSYSVDSLWVQQAKPLGYVLLSFLQHLLNGLFIIIMIQDPIEKSDSDKEKE
jgi:hypothetical protein